MTHDNQLGSENDLVRTQTCQMGGLARVRLCIVRLARLAKRVVKYWFIESVVDLSTTQQAHGLCRASLSMISMMDRSRPRLAHLGKECPPPPPSPLRATTASSFVVVRRRRRRLLCRCLLPRRALGRDSHGIVRALLDRDCDLGTA